MRPGRACMQCACLTTAHGLACMKAGGHMPISFLLFSTYKPAAPHLHVWRELHDSRIDRNQLCHHPVQGGLYSGVLAGDGGDGRREPGDVAASYLSDESARR
jgi:hypothetical protein